MENKSITKNTTLEIVQIALFIAATCMVTMTIRIPTMIGYTHLGDSMVCLSAILLGKTKCELCHLMDEQEARPDVICMNLLEASTAIGNEVHATQYGGRQ